MISPLALVLLLLLELTLFLMNSHPQIHVTLFVCESKYCNPSIFTFAASLTILELVGKYLFLIAIHYLTYMAAAIAH